MKKEGVDVLRVQAELVHLFSLLASGELWNVAPFNTAAEAPLTFPEVSLML